MTEQDRLAELLRDLIPSIFARRPYVYADGHVAPVIDANAATILASRLAAAGVFLCPRCASGICSAHRPDLDEERLARALRSDVVGAYPERAAAIAAAYRGLDS